MKKYINVLLCGIVLLVSIFAMFRIDTTVKAENKNSINTIIDEINKIESEEINKNIKEEIDKIKKEEKERQALLERKRLEKEKAKVIRTNTREKSSPNSNPTTRTNSVKYGTFGRLYVSGYSVALYDYNVNTSSSSSLQTLVNNQDSAAYYMNKGKLIIADHYYQGFSVLTSLNQGATSYIKFKDGAIVRYRLIKKSRGVNTGPDLKDTNGNSFFNMRSDIIMYTCYSDGIMATLWVLA